MERSAKIINLDRFRMMRDSAITEDVQQIHRGLGTYLTRVVADGLLVHDLEFRGDLSETVRRTLRRRSISGSCLRTAYHIAVWNIRCKASHLSRIKRGLEIWAKALTCPQREQKINLTKIRMQKNKSIFCKND